MNYTLIIEYRPKTLSSVELRKEIPDYTSLESALGELRGLTNVVDERLRITGFVIRHNPSEGTSQVVKFDDQGLHSTPDLLILQEWRQAEAKEALVDAAKDGLHDMIQEIRK